MPTNAPAPGHYAHKAPQGAPKPPAPAIATIQSYLVYPAEGSMDRVAECLAAMPGCEVLPAANRPVLVLVTETPDRNAQRELERRLESMDNIACLSLVSGWAVEE